MRENKNIDKRKNQIMDYAMKLFAESGYENITIEHIAEGLNLDVDLCYHYFKSKQSLYDEALKSYVNLCSEDIIRVFDSKPPINDIKDVLRDTVSSVKAKSKYSDFFDKNKQFHMQLEYEMAEKIVPHAAEYLKMLKDKGQINIDDPKVTAKFILHGEMSLFNDDKYATDNIQYVQNMIWKILK